MVLMYVYTVCILYYNPHTRQSFKGALTSFMSADYCAVQHSNTEYRRSIFLLEATGIRWNLQP